MVRAEPRARAGEQPPPDEDGSQLWLRYVKVSLPARLAEYQAGIAQIVRAGASATLQAAQNELSAGLSGLLGAAIPVENSPTGAGAVVLGTPASSTLVNALGLGGALAGVGGEGYLVRAMTVGGKAAIVIAGNTDVGVLHGSFAFLRWLQRQQPLANLALAESPKIQRRMLNHWDNLDGTIERGYAGDRSGTGASCPGRVAPLHGLRARQRLDRHQRRRRSTTSTPTRGS